MTFSPDHPDAPDARTGPALRLDVLRIRPTLPNEPPRPPGRPRPTAPFPNEPEKPPPRPRPH